MRLAKHGNLVPVWTSVPADLLTPVSAYLKLTQTQDRSKRPDNDFSFLLESVEGGENVARYTYMGSDPFLILRYRITTHRDGSASGVADVAEKSSHGNAYRTRSVDGDIAEIARRLIQQFHPIKPEGLPPFSAGAVGYITYNLI